ncbi:aminopeptidase [Pelobium manganitolerans]|uniref:Aminopeptidase N n=1 Tax=Pelobium manganitolerans TaxID=1842495 RepID=A0A419S1G8_9SPHI|nr:M1 family metallopeptidase [Pelobium manganitolerans]RKD12329.1 aminopeptidase [Pelobium manganitolerans]
MRKLLFIIPVILLSCTQNKKEQKAEEAKAVQTGKDPHSFSNPEEAVVNHLDLDLKVDFAKQQITGIATWTIQHLKNADEIVFDTQDLTIDKVTLDEDSTGVFFALGDKDPVLGQALSIPITNQTQKIKIYYSTAKSAAALQWLNPQQTAGKQQPFLFTQSQAILARSWIPTQDSPGIRFTYTANVEVPNNLLALMSAENPQKKSADGKYKFVQPHPIPSYLMALAVGDIAFKAIDQRTGVYAEPVMLSKVAYEFADMGKMVNAAEKMYGDYRWGRYDVLVLPPSFPFGGMENPLLTFATPTVIAGDRSLVSLVAHELAHSWSGNLVTNATWNDFWLNEGFTVYFERRIIEALYGADEAKMQEVLGYQSLMEGIKEMGDKNPDTRLKVDFTGRNPDDNVSDIAYEKGYFFLKTIEQAVGRQKFDAFLKDYFSRHAFKTIDNDTFLNELNQLLIKGDEKLKKQIDSYAWVYQPGLPKEFKAPSSSVFNNIDSLTQQFLATKNAGGLSKKITSTNEKLYFIHKLPDNVGQDAMKLVDAEFNFTASKNAEVQCAWYVLAVKNKYEKAYPAIKEFLTEVGRRKFLMPIYKELAKTAEGKKSAKEIYKNARANYHSVSYNSIDDLLE